MIPSNQETCCIHTNNSQVVQLIRFKIYREKLIGIPKNKNNTRTGECLVKNTLKKQKNLIFLLLEVEVIL
jgi:hypothetical protein